MINCNSNQTQGEAEATHPRATISDVML